LEIHHASAKEAWLFIYKKHTGKKTLTYPEAVEEAICFGWIDSLMRFWDDEKFAQRFSPRKTGSLWSMANRKKAEAMIQAGKMTPAGMRAIEEAKKNGRWDSAYTSREKPVMSEDLKKALMKNKAAWENFNKFANSQQLMAIYWVNLAKRPETKDKRIRHIVQRAARNKKFFP
jgi:uncharacterized protein YdeI (YjbR/CyaY-like superfamily)